MKDTVKIRNFEDLNSIDGERRCEFILTEDINAQGKNLNNINVFNGTLDGRGHVIRGLSGKQNGLITTNTGIIKNLHIRKLEWNGEGVKSGYHCGIICDINGTDEKKGKVMNCSVEGELKEYDEVGGIVNENRNGEIINCTSNCIIKDANLAGGIVAKNYDKVARCGSVCKIKNIQRLSGGISGLNLNGTIKNSCFTGIIKYTSEAGGISARNLKKGKIVFCHTCPTLERNWKSGILTSHCSNSSIENSSYRLEDKGNFLTDYASNSLIRNCYWITDMIDHDRLIAEKEEGTKVESVNRASSLLEAKKNILIGSI